jgi:hypothetical protein
VRIIRRWIRGWRFFWVFRFWQYRVALIAKTDPVLAQHNYLELAQSLIDSISDPDLRADHQAKFRVASDLVRAREYQKQRGENHD